MLDLPTIFLAEDDDGHAQLIQNGLRKAGFQNPLIRFHDGQEALEYLTSLAVPSAAFPALPRVLLLDIRMPKVGGIEVLRQIRENPAFDVLPVIMLTTTDDPREAQHCRQLGCNYYIVKPVNATLFNAALQGLAGFLSPGEPPAKAD